MTEPQSEATHCMIRYERDGRLLAVASVHRDMESMKAEAAIEPGGMQA